MKKRWRVLDILIAVILSAAYWLFFAMQLSVANHKSCRPVPQCWEQGATAYWTILIGAVILYTLLASAYVVWARRCRTGD